MKRLLLFSALVLLVGASELRAQTTNPRRVLIEEFTNTGCPPCAATDPMMEEFEAANQSEICVLKYHVSWPDNTDPFYNVLRTESDPRIQKYYGANGVPYSRFSGMHGDYVTSFNDASQIKDVTDSVYGLGSPYKMTITQRMTTDSIFADVTVTTTGTAPTESDLRLAVVFAERYNPFHGSNGRPFYTSIVRKVLPGVASDGTIAVNSTYPVFSLAQGQTQTYHYAAKIGPTWNRDQMMAVTFIQSASTKEVFQSNWTLPDVSVAGEDGTFNTYPLSSPLSFTLTNNAKEAQTVQAKISAPTAPAAWNLHLSGADANGSVTLAPGETKTVSITGDNVAKAIGYANATIYFSTADNVGITGREASIFGQDTKDLIVDATGDVSKLMPIADAMNATGYAAAIIDDASFGSQTSFPDWTIFNHIFYNLGESFGQFQYATNLQTLGGYIDNGGKVLLMSDVLPSGYYSAYQQNNDETWLDYIRTNLNIEPKPAVKNSTWTKVNGIPGDPISGNLSTTLAGKVLYRQPLGIAAGATNTYPIFTNERGDTVGIRAEIGTGRLVYLSFPLDTVAAADRIALATNIMNWLDGVAGVNEHAPQQLSLANYPNPTSGATTIQYSIPGRAAVTVSVRDLLGHEVLSTSNGVQDAGSHSTTLDASKLVNGNYIYTVTAGAYRTEGKMTVAH